MKCFATLALIMVLSPGYGQDIVNPYKIIAGDSVLTDSFRLKICEAARLKTNEEAYHTELEKLISYAAGSSPGALDQREKLSEWWESYGITCLCEPYGKFPGGNFMRQAIHANFRLFINVIGGINRLSLNLEIPDPQDSLTLLEYVNQNRMRIESSYKNNRKKFQRDSEWMNFIFFYMLLSEFKITYEK